MASDRFSGVYIHPSVIIEDGVEIGLGSRIYVNTQVRTGAKIGSECIIGKDCYIDAGVVIGNRCKIQNGVSVYHGVTLEDGVFLGPHMTTTNDLNPAAINPDGSLKRIDDWKLGRTIFETGARVGAHATIICGDPVVRIGKWSLIGAGAVVTRGTTDFGLYVGNPAKWIRDVCPADLGHEVKSIEDMENGAHYLVCQVCRTTLEEVLKGRGISYPHPSR